MSSTTFEKLESRFDPQAAKGMDEIFQFHFSDEQSHYLHVQDGTLGIHEGEHDDPSVTLTTSTETLRGIMSGDISGMSAFMSGKLKASGNVMLATKLTSLFPGQ
ncbi:SCP2 sterol-binding domain-containing protein [Halomonas sp. HMF6819]|uniref:SCP2 sterol-binding domain-containing protein n=1 Tax=unclassified Halomonas TaxID=2609666 RepID=UPI002076B11E|nr:MULTISPECIES: SCP2 sterol-binding domain-containing protein [unclassified Halomonas]